MSGQPLGYTVVAARPSYRAEGPTDYEIATILHRTREQAEQQRAYCEGLALDGRDLFDNPVRYAVAEVRLAGGS